MAGCSLIHKKSLPVSPYTDEELVDYMDKAGLGTVSTRTNILRTLLERKYIRIRVNMSSRPLKGFSCMRRYAV